MTDTHRTGFKDKVNGNYMPHLHGMQLRSAQQRLVAALLRRPGLVPTTMRSGIQQGDFSEELRNAFIIATNQPESVDRILNAGIAFGIDDSTIYEILRSEFAHD